MDYDILIIGAGVVGLAISAKLSAKYKCLLLEKNYSFGMDSSSRNSEVIHAGIYYPQNSLKAELCVKGNRLLYKWCLEHNVPHLKIGKYIIAINDEDSAELEQILHNGFSNGVENLSHISISDFKKYEPNIKASSVLFSKETGIIDSHKLMESFVEVIKSNDSDIVYNHKFVNTEFTGQYYKSAIEYNNNEIFELSSKFVINSAGLYSDKIAENCGIDIEKYYYKLHWCKGHYYRIVNYPIVSNRLIYPTPPKDNAGLGIHLTKELGGGYKLGPDTKFLNTHEIDYSINDEYLEKFYQAASRYIKNLKIENISPDQAGIRPKLQAKDGLFRDFVINEESDKGLPGLINLIGIESPGLSSCIAISEYVSQFIK
jgi:L-2-hydroxyglutarate oxidase LhgO